MNKHQIMFQPKAAARLLLLTLLALPILACDNYSGPTITVGDTEIKLLSPPGLIRVDGRNATVDSIFKKNYPSDSRILALFADEYNWEEVMDALDSQGPSMVRLKYFALMGTPKASTVQRIKKPDLDQRLKAGLQEQLEARGAEVLEAQPRYITLTADWTPPDGGSEMFVINSVVLVKGIIIELGIAGVGDSNSNRAQIERLALDWRDAYLAETKP